MVCIILETLSGYNIFNRKNTLSSLSNFLNLFIKPEKNYFDEAKHPLPLPLEFLLFKLIFTSTTRGYESLTFSKHDFTKKFIALYTFSPVFALAPK
jgi:hypothetical protein